MTAVRRSLWVGAAFVVAMAAGWLLRPGRETPDAQQLARGAAIYAAHCAACHGANLEGQPDWQTALPDGTMPAPPLNGAGHAHHHPKAELFQTVKEGMASVNGGKPSNMPGFGDVLSDEEINVVLGYIESHW